MSQYRFYLDSTEVTPPNNFDEYSEDLIRDDTKRHVFYDYPISLEFIGDGYDYLDSVYKADYNSQVELKIVEITANVENVLVNSIIKLSNVNFDLIRFTATCEVDDSVYQAYLFSNYSVEVGAGVTSSKNGVDIPAITPIDLVVFNPVTGEDLPDVRRAFDVIDFFEMIINYISDGEINFQSDWYDALPDNQRLAVVAGVELRTGDNTVNPVTSLEAIFNELWKKYNLYLIVENPINGTTVRLEQESYLYGDTQVSVDYCENLARGIDFERLYSTIKIGSNKSIRERGTSFLLPYLTLFGFTEETFNIGGVINVDNTLDLVSDYIIDTNVIEDILVNEDDGYDDEIVIIQYDRTTNAAIKGTYFSTTDPDSRLYNEQLLNSKVAERFDFIGDIILATGLVEVGYKATQTVNRTNLFDFNNFGDTVDVLPLETWIFQNDSTDGNFDIGDNYNPVTGVFTAPETGEYAFRVIMRIATFGNPSEPPGRPGFDIRMSEFISVNGDTDVEPTSQTITQVYASGSQTTETIDYFDPFQIPVGVQETFVEIFQLRTLSAGDTAEVKIRLRVTAVTALTWIIGISNSVSQLLVNPLAGGIYVPKDADAYYIQTYSAKQILLSEAQWQLVRDNVNLQVALSSADGLPRLSYPKKISRNFVTGSTEIETLSNRQQAVI